MAAADLEFAWLAGLLEGEGCFFNRSDRYFSPLIQLVMTDKDVVIRAAKAMESHKVVRCRQLTKAGKEIFRTNVYGATAERLMRRLLPYMGTRRSQKIMEILAAADRRYRSAFPDRKPHSKNIGATVVWLRESDGR
jgi:hypothetical protein